MVIVTNPNIENIKLFRQLSESRVVMANLNKMVTEYTPSSVYLFYFMRIILVLGRYLYTRLRIGKKVGVITLSVQVIWRPLHSQCLRSPESGLNHARSKGTI